MDITDGLRVKLCGLKLIRNQNTAAPSYHFFKLQDDFIFENTFTPEVYCIKYTMDPRCKNGLKNYNRFFES